VDGIYYIIGQRLFGPVVSKKKFPPDAFRAIAPYVLGSMELL